MLNISTRICFKNLCEIIAISWVCPCTASTASKNVPVITPAYIHSLGNSEEYPAVSAGVMQSSIMRCKNTEADTCAAEANSTQTSTAISRHL